MPPNLQVKPEVANKIVARVPSLIHSDLRQGRAAFASALC
jgi:hypothetical protein